MVAERVINVAKRSKKECKVTIVELKIVSMEELTNKLLNYTKPDFDKLQKQHPEEALQLDLGDAQILGRLTYCYTIKLSIP